MMWLLVLLGIWSIILVGLPKLAIWIAKFL